MKFMKKLKKAKKDNKGFSLVELIIVIAIMAILVGIVGTQVIPYINKSKEAKDYQIINSYSTAAMTAYATYAEKVTADTTVKVYGVGSDGASLNTNAEGMPAADLEKEIKTLTYDSLPTASFQSTKGKEISYILIEYKVTGTGQKSITTQAYDEHNVAVFDAIVSYM